MKSDRPILSHTMGSGPQRLRVNRRHLVLWGGSGLLIAIIVVSLILMAGSRRAARVAEYQTTLSRLSDEVVRINNPLAEMFARGLTPDRELVKVTREELSTIKTDLEALGPPPVELAEAHAALTESLRQFGQAYDRLATNLETGVDSPFDADFLASATHGGEAIHHVARVLYQISILDQCVGLRRLWPACWLGS